MAAEQHVFPSLTVDPDRPLVGVVMIEDGREVVRYCADEADTDDAVASQVAADARALAGAWADLDWDDAVEALDLIRHQSEPTPPIEALRRYLLDTTPMTAYLFGRPPVVALVDPWLERREAATSILVYGEVIEYLMGRPAFPTRRAQLRRLLRAIPPLFLSYSVLDRYALIRRNLRPPHGPGLIGDVDVLVAATALERGLTVVTTDSDYSRVPGLSMLLLDRTTLLPVGGGAP